MPEIRLPPELISLVHHVELNKAGWWEKCLQRLILAAIWLADDRPTEEAIAQTLDTAFHVTPDASKLKAQLDVLRDEGTITALPGGRLRLATTALATFVQELREAEEIESYVRQKFSNVLAVHCPSVENEDAWLRFDQNLLIPLVRETGANTYGLLTGGQLRMEAVRIEKFLQDYPREVHAPLQKAITDFLDPSDTKVCSYVFRLLHAHFCIEAGNLRDDTLSMLRRVSESPAAYSVFVDTNFLFSLLSLHDNPSNQAATLLRALIAQLADDVGIKLYILPSTIHEAKNALIHARASIEGIPPARNLTAVALRAGLSGMAQKYFEERSKPGRLLTAEDYFGPYIKDLVAVARSKGVELYNDNVDGYKVRQDVVDDIQDQMKFEAKRPQRAKGYEQIEHDMVLWHFVRDKRRGEPESPLEGRYWIVTVDYRLLGFDAYKRRAEGFAVPLCLHPSSVVSMLQFWVPRSAAFEEAMLGTMRLPFLFQEFDAEAEKITLRILQAIGRFEGIGDLSEEVIAGVVCGDAIRGRIEAATDEQEEVELIRDALIEELKGNVQEKAKGMEKLRHIAAEKDRTIENLQRSKEELEENVTALKGAMQSTESNLSDVQQELERQARVIADLEASLEAKNKEAEAHKVIRRFVIWWTLIAVGTFGLIAPLLSLLIVKAFNLSAVRTAMSVYLTSALLLIIAADTAGAKEDVVRDWHLFRHFRKFPKWLLGVIVVGLVLELVGNYLWTWCS